MPCSSQPAVERARPLLGTRVAVRAGGLPADAANRAIDAAFAEIALIHGLMSFHDGDSEISRLNREAFQRPVPVHRHTMAVLRWAREIAAQSRGGFDITVAAKLVDWGILPAPAGTSRPDPTASWLDIELHDDGTVRFGKPLWIDVGGIAKGYAVDCATDVLRRFGAVQSCVDAGGDLRIAGPDAERVGLRPDMAFKEGVPVVELANLSVASSCGYASRRKSWGRFAGPHVDGRRGWPVGTGSFVSVVAESCVLADALTKVVLALRRQGDRLLRRYRATAYLYSSGRGWRAIGEAAHGA